jgi:hypothetical protein
MAILNDNEFVEFEGRSYANPQTALDESNSFIENLRNTQQANNRQIQTDTYNLGTAVPSNLGGLTSPVGEGGSGDAGLSYFTSRYQTPQTNAVVENLRSVAQAQALNQVLQNEQEKWQKRYNDAYRNYQKRAYDNPNGGGGGDDDDDYLEYGDTGELTGFNAEQDKNINSLNIEGTNYTETGFDNRSRQTKNKVEVTRDKSGNIRVVTINGVPHYGREAQARYRDLKRKGIVE